MATRQQAILPKMIFSQHQMPRLNTTSLDLATYHYRYIFIQRHTGLAAIVVKVGRRGCLPSIVFNPWRKLSRLPNHVVLPQAVLIGKPRPSPSECSGTNTPRRYQWQRVNTACAAIANLIYIPLPPIARAIYSISSAPCYPPAQSV